LIRVRRKLLVYLFRMARWCVVDWAVRQKAIPEFAKILVRATNWVGDAVMSLPALQAIRTRFPQAHIAVLARPWVADLYEREPVADRVILLTSARGAKDLSGKWRAAQSLRRERFDCAILLQNAFEAALIAWLAGIPRRIGYNRDGRGLLLTDPIRLPDAGEIPGHQRFYYLEMLRRAGIIDGDLPDTPIQLSQTAGPRGRIVGVSPGAAFGGAKRWPAGRFAAAAAEIAAQLGCSVAVFGSQNERELCEEVARSVEARGLVVRNFAAETTLRAFMDLVAGCLVYLTNDSGAMHVACALGVPTVAVFGPTDDSATGPVGSWTRVVREPVDCSPCLLRECPTDHRCMERVAVSRVVEAALDLVGS
jgi:heptosyltransferase-2